MVTDKWLANTVQTKIGQDISPQVDASINSPNWQGGATRSWLGSDVGLRINCSSGIARTFSGDEQNQCLINYVYGAGATHIRVCCQ